MNTRIFEIGLCLSLWAIVARGGDDRPILKESPAGLVSVIQTRAEENVAAARVNVAHDVAHKRLRIFSSMPDGKAGEFKEYGFDLEIVYAPTAASTNAGAGSYRFQNNNQILSFAAAQFSSGNKAFAKRLVGLLAEAEPGLFWSSPTDPVMTIKQVLAGLQEDDDSVKPFLADESRTWAETIKRYGS